MPAIGSYILRQNQRIQSARDAKGRSGAGAGGGMLLPLAGVAVGDGWIDPVRQIDAYPEMMFGQGMISMVHHPPRASSLAEITRPSDSTRGV